MFYDNEISMGIMEKKYLQPGETPEQWLDRVVSIFSPDLQDDIRYAISQADFLPAGRTLAGAGLKGKRKMSTSNCYICPSPKDNIESIFDTAKMVARISSYGGGCGIALDNLRPKDALVNNSARSSTGAVSFLNLFDVTSGTIGQSGRRGALMVGLRCDHPDIYEFLRVKENNEKLASMNISIKFTNEFMEAVRDHKEFHLHFESVHENIERDIDAAEFFEEFCKVNADWGDPGCIFIDRVRSYHLLSGYPEYQIDISNPCAEYYGIGGNSCLTGDTLVRTSDGVRRLDTLVKSNNDLVYSIDDRLEPYSKVVSQGIKKTYTLTLSNGSQIRATDNHKFLTLDGWKELRDLVVGDKIMVCNKPNIIPVNRYDEVYEMYGWMHGDGWFNTTVGISFNYGDGDKDIKARLLPVFKDVFDCHNVKPLKDDNVSFQLQVEKKSAIQHCLEMGFVPCRAADKELPTTFYDWSLIQQLSFIRGLFSADGFILGPTNSQIAFASTSRKFVRQVQDFLATIGIQSRLFSVSFQEELHRKPQHKIVITKQSAKDYFNIIGFSGSKKNSKYKPGRMYKNDTYYAVKDISEAETEEVFDIVEVGNTNAFYANGIAVHNCNLGSINLYNMIDDKFTREAHVNYERLGTVVNIAVQALDEILTYGYVMQPLDLNRKVIDDWRSIGLGIFGLADALVAMGIRYGSKESIEFVSDVMEHIMLYALETSSDLAHHYGSFRKYDFEKICESQIIKAFPYMRDKIEMDGLRNGSLISIAPTGTISLFAGRFTGGVEPMYQVAYERTSHSTEDEGKTFFVYARGVEDLLKFHGIDPQKITVDEIKARFPFVIESHEVPWKERVALQGVMQDYVDNSISSTVNLPNSATWEDIRDIYMFAWEQGLKGITVFRDGCKRGNILGVSKDEPVESTYNMVEPLKRGSTYRVDGSTFKQRTACVPSMYVTVNKSDTGDLMEVFTNASGGCQANINTITRLVSLLLRAGVKRDIVIEELRENQCPACQALRRQGKSLSLSCGNAIADAMTAMLDDESTVEHDGYLVCPECGKHTLRPEGKCFTCSNCGYSKCD